MSICKYQFLISFLIFVFGAKNVYLSHFRGAVIMVRPKVGGQTNEIEISYQISWRRDSSGGGSCNLTQVTNNNLLINGESTLRCQYGCSDNIMSPISYACMCFSTEDNWSFGENQVTHAFNNPSDQNTITIGTNGNAWVSGGRWNVSTMFSLVARSDTGTVNSSPRILSSLPLRLQYGCSYTIPLAITDPDNDIIRCRWAVSPECGGVCDNFPGAVLNNTLCTIHYTANEVGLKHAAIMIEDYAPGSLNRPLSSVALQFIVSVINSTQECLVEPEYFSPPSITIHPSNTVIWNESLNITLTCLANEVSSYFWERENDNIPINSIGIQTDTFTLLNVLPSDAGNYRCVINQLHCGISRYRFSDYARIVINVMVPVFVSHPQSQYIYPTQTATFTCNANGYNVNYEWRIRNGSFPSKAMGIHSNTLVIPDVALSDDNAYTCVASNIAGSVSSYAANLIVTGVTVAVVSSPTGTPVSGSTNTFDYMILSTVTLTCDVLSNHGLPFSVSSYQWNSAGCYTNTNYNHGAPGCFPHGQTTQHVTGNDLTAEDAGTITCTVTIDGSNYTMTSALFTLRILGIGITFGNIIAASHLLTNYSYINAGSGESMIIARCLTGLGPLNNNDNNALGELSFNEARVPNGDCSNHESVIQSNGTSIAHFVGAINLFQCGTFSPTEEGVYSCVILNSSLIYEDMKIGIYFSGRTAPVINTPSLLNITVAVGLNITLSCISRGSPPDAFIWRKNNGSAIQSTSITTITHTSADAVFLANYSIDNITTSDNGIYTCTVTNPIGSDSANITVMAIDCPPQMMYMQCGHYATCLFLNANIPRNLDCESGCFCKDGTVHYNGSCSEVDICDCEIGITDLVFVLDASENIGLSNFQLIKELLYNLTMLLSIGPTRSQVAVILYSSNASLYFNLNDHRSTELLLQDISNIPYYSNSEESNIAAALNLLYSSYMDGSLKARDNHEHVAILFTDGLPDDFTATRTVANNLRFDTDFQIYVVETNGTDPVAAEYAEIALDTSYVLSAPNFNVLALQQIMERIIQNLDSNLERLCNVLTVSDNVTVYPGETATFYCNGSSDEALSSTYQWEKVELNGKKDVIFSDDDVDSSGSIFDYTNILMINSVNFTDNGVGFYCGAADFSNSEVAYINVLAPSIASIPMTPLLLQAFSSTMLSCNALGGPRLIIRWYGENQLLLSGQIGDTSLTYDISSANVTDNGDYMCIAVVDDHYINSTVINILVSPIIFIGIINTTAIKEENVTFRCQTTYSINTTVTWKFNDSDVDISNVSKYEVINTVISGTIFESNLMIINVTLLDVGMYTCVAVNEAGNDISDGFLSVNVPPSLLSSSDRVVTNVFSENVMLICVAFGLPAPNITWFDAENEEIYDNDRTIINVTHNSDITSLIKVTSTLEILYPQNADGGVYQCTADNGLSVALNRIVLVVLDPLSVLNFNGYQVESGAVINTFVSNFDDSSNSSGNGTDPYKELDLMCSALDSNDSVKWIVISSNDNSTISITTVNNLESNITVRISEGELTVACISEVFLESINITITTENPYVRLISNSNISATLGTRQELEFVIAIDSDGSKLQQNSVLNLVNFTFDNLINATTLQLAEANEFQHYTYVSPPIDNSSAGIYALIFENITLTNATIALNNKVPNLTISINMIPLEGQPITLNCSTSEDDIVVKWLFKGEEIALDDERYMFSPPGLNNILTIINPNISESGNYSCEIDTDTSVETNAMMNIVVSPACKSEFANGILWNAIKRNQTSYLECSSLHSTFTDRVHITRSCNYDGRWSNVNSVNCIMRIGSRSVVVTSLIFPIEEGTQQNYLQLAEKITSIITVNNIMINPMHELFTFSALGDQFAVIRISFEMESKLSESVASEITTAINLYLSNATFTLEVIGLQPSNSCSCIPPNREIIKNVCIGPNGTPLCNCNENDPCQCNAPIFAGNGTYCGKDTDEDAIPDEQDECPLMYFNSSNGCPPDISDSDGCPKHNEIDWKISWPTTNIGETATQKCPGGIESIGLATKDCGKDRIWNNNSLDVSQCQSVEIYNILMEVEALDSNATLSELTEITSMISNALNSTNPILPKDLQSTNQILNTILSLASEGDGDPVNVTKEVIVIIDMVLEETNFPSFEAAERNQSSEILGTTEEAVKILGSTMDGSNQPVVVRGDNLFVEAQSLQGGDAVKFPSSKTAFNESDDTDDIKLNIPVGENEIVVNFIATTLGYLLQSTQNSSMQEIRSSVVSTQIFEPLSQTSRSKPLPESKVVMTLEFNINKENISNPIAGCYSWDFIVGTCSHINAVSEWSNDGIEVDETNSSYIRCTSEHLTSFAVLVAPGDESEDVPLSIISYIGCSISIVCLLLTLCAIFLWRKHVFNQVQHYIHFNLSMSLLLGLIVFVSAIETAVGSNVGCLIVALLLHYFFLAAFCWMLCEGLLVFILLYLVFYKGFFKEWKFFTLIGWGLPIPVIIVSAAVSHEQYGTDRICWISYENGAIWAFIAPILLIIMINVFFIIMTLRRIYLTQNNKLNAKDVSRRDIARSLAKASCVLLPLLGITWIFGIFAVNEEAVFFAWIFVLLNSLQGAFIFILHVLRNEKFRDRIKAIRRGEISKLFTSTGGENTLKSGTLPKERVSSTSGTDDTGAVKMLDSYNNVIRNEYTVSSTNLAPEYYQKYQQTVPNPFNMPNTVDEFVFDEDDTIRSMRRKRLSTNIDITPSEYLHRNRQAVVSSNTVMDDEGEVITSL